MSPAAKNLDLLAAYPAFGYGKFGVRESRPTNRLLRVNLYLSVISLVFMAGAASADSTLFLPGRDVGFLEHPAIFAFLLAQCVLPYSAARGLRLFALTPKWSRGILDSAYLDEQFVPHSEFLRNCVYRRNNIGSASFNLLIFVGFLAFAWNSIANQSPYRFAGFDFWDSSLHFWGYLSTRIYKFYMWVMFFPAVLHSTLIMLVCMRRIVARAAAENKLSLEPYHPDGCGGVKVFMDSVLKPFVPALGISSALAFAAVLIHRKIDVTTVGALGLVCITFATLYLVLATALRRAIRLEKNRQLRSISELQNAQFFNLIRGQTAFSPADTNTTISSLSDLARHVKNLPNWPQLRFVVRVISLASSSPVTAWVVGLLTPKIAKFFGI